MGSRTKLKCSPIPCLRLREANNESKAHGIQALPGADEVLSGIGGSSSARNDEVAPAAQRLFDRVVQAFSVHGSTKS
jgi:hypothetical protein